MKHSLGKKIKIDRKELDMTQVGLAKLIKVSPQKICYYEKEHAVPARPRLEEIAKALNKPISYFLDEVDSSVKDETYTLTSTPINYDRNNFALCSFKNREAALKTAQIFLSDATGVEELTFRLVDENIELAVKFKD